LLKLGMSLASLDKKQEACAAFQKLKEDYPNAPAGLKNTMQREWQKNGCV
jgi:TolA-binding protein